MDWSLESLLSMIVDKKMREVVERAKERWRQQVQELVRDLSGLKLTSRRNVGEEQVRLKIIVKDGLPEPLRNISVGIDPRMAVGELIGLWQAELSQIQNACERLTESDFFNRLSELGWTSVAEDYSAIEKAKQVVRRMLEEAQKAQLLKRILEIQKDVLGAYFPHRSKLYYSALEGWIELYWLVIGAVARWLGVSVEGLTVAVLTHEMVHAYTHLGMDIDGQRWDEGFLKSPPEIVEGLAQYYTHKAMEALKSRGYMDGWEAYVALLKWQVGPYREHEKWLNRGYTPEVVRAAFLVLQKSEFVSPEEFHGWMETLSKQLKRESTSRQQTWRL